jgi:hypothetical protein
MTIEIRDASLEARTQKQLQATGSSSVAIPRALPEGRLLLTPSRAD